MCTLIALVYINSTQWTKILLKLNIIYRSGNSSPSQKYSTHTLSHWLTYSRVLPLVSWHTPLEHLRIRHIHSIMACNTCDSSDYWSKFKTNLDKALDLKFREYDANTAKVRDDLIHSTFASHKTEINDIKSRVTDLDVKLNSTRNRKLCWC